MSTLPALAKTPSSSSAPESTKNSTSTGAVQWSALRMISSDSGQRLQNTLPSIMHTSSGEKPIVAPPAGILSIESATVRNTKEMLIAMRLVFEWKKGSIFDRPSPASEPRNSEQRISSSGLTTMVYTSTTPLERARAMPKDTAKTTRPTASSSATIGSSSSVSLPLALYWRTTISVAAGAVAAAMAPSVMAAGTDSAEGNRTCSPSSAASTISVVTRACRMPITRACLPVSRSWERRNSLPMEKAMKPSATSEITPSISSSSKLEKPTPGMCSAPITQGPISTPATR